MLRGGFTQCARQEPVLVLDRLRAVAAVFQRPYPARDVFFSQGGERDRADDRVDVVFDVAGVVVDALLLDAGQLVDVTFQPLGDSQLGRGASAGVGVDAVHFQRSRRAVRIDGGLERLGLLR